MHRPGDEDASEIDLTVPQMPELARMLTDYVNGMIPLHGLGPDDRFEFEKILGALQDYLRHDLPYESMASRGHGVIAALPDRGKIEWRVIDLDAGSSEPTGGRIYRVSPAVAAQWMLANLLSSQELLSIGDVIAIRDAAAKIINGKLNGEQETNRLSSLIRNAFIEHWEREGEDLRVVKMRAMQQSDLDRVNLFCQRHAPLKLDPARMLRTATEIDMLRQAAINIAVKLAHGVAAAIGAAQFGATVAEMDGNGRLSYGELNRAEFGKSTAKLFDKAFTEIEDKLKLLLTAATKTKIKLVSRVDTVSEWLSNRVVEHVAEQFGDGNYSITISASPAEHDRRDREQLVLGHDRNALEGNDCVGVMLTGAHAGTAVHLADCSEFGLIYPLRRVTNI